MPQHFTPSYNEYAARNFAGRPEDSEPVWRVEKRGAAWWVLSQHSNPGSGPHDVSYGPYRDETTAKSQLATLKQYGASVYGHCEKFAVSGSRFTHVSQGGLRDHLTKQSDGVIAKYLAQLGEPESPSESRMPKVERLVMGWMDGRLPDLAKDCGLEPPEDALRKRYGG